MFICRRCGVYAPPETGVCDWCNHALQDSGRVEIQRQHRCAAVRVMRRCGSCSQWTPIDGLPADRRAACGRCGAEARVDDATWIRLLDRAHAVADLVGDHPEGFEPSAFAIDAINPFAPLARRAAAIRFAHGEADAVEDLPADLRVLAAPGLPIDPDGRGPLALDRLSPGVVRAVAGGETGRYTIPEWYVGAYPALLGVIANDHRAGQEPAVTADARGRWGCPACGGALARTDGSRFRVRCGACGAVASVPARLRHHRVSDPKPDTLWMLFDGPSPERRRLERDPARGADPRPDDRELEQMPLVASSRSGRALQVAYVAVVPVLLFALAGLISRGPALWVAVRGWLSP